MTHSLWWSLGIIILGVVFYSISWWKFYKLRLQLKHIPRVEAEILWEHLRHRKNFAEIAAKLGESRAEVEYRYDRGMQRLTYLREHL